MKINSVEIQNCKSFRSETKLNIDNRFNILVGPNGGGKSNTLDIITDLIRNYFLPSYTISERKIGGKKTLRINEQNHFNNIQQHLDKYSGYEREANSFKIEFLLQEEDLSNIRALIKNKDQLNLDLQKYENTPLRNLDFLDTWNIELIENFNLGIESPETITLDDLHFQDNWDIKVIEDLGTVSYKIKNWQLNQIREQGLQKWIYEYLRYLPLFLILTRDNNQINLNPLFLYFSPYRGASPQDLQANLSSNNYYDLLSQYHTKTSQDITSLIRLASLYFANKKRKYESEADQQGFAEKWDTDNEVKLVDKYMEKLGYDWGLNLIDENKNIYEIQLSKEGRTFNISQASSGEKEILNFLLGVFAFQIAGGIIIVDEPELHLHPKWQALLRSLFLELSKSTNNQFIISTHSPVFLTPKTLPNIRRLYKNHDGATQINSLDDGDIDNRKSLLHIVNSHNNERMFFADHVVLVEGVHDRLVFEALLKHLRDKFDAKVIVEVLEVYGKGNFSKYDDFLDGFGIKVSKIGDQDYLNNLNGINLGGLFETKWKKINDSVLKGKKSKDRIKLAELLNKAIIEDDKEKLQNFWDYVKGRHTKIKDDLTQQEKADLNQTIADLRDKNIYILRKGEIENYLPEEYQSLSNTIELLKEENFEEWISKRNEDIHLTELCLICLDILAIEKDKFFESSTAGSVVELDS